MRALYSCSSLFSLYLFLCSITTLRLVMEEEGAFPSSALLRWVCAVVVTFPVTSLKYPNKEEGLVLPTIKVGLPTLT